MLARALEHDIRGFDVEMQRPRAVRRLAGAQQIGEQPPGASVIELAPLREHVAHTAPGKVVHDEEAQSVGYQPVVNPRHIARPQRQERGELALYLRLLDRTLGRAEEFDGNRRGQWILVAAVTFAA